jgi:hypothetical protein
MEQQLDALEAKRRRAAKKQNLFRQVNDRIESLAATESSAVFICECLQDECDERLSLTLEQYEDVRSSPSRFLVLGGHQLLEAGDVVEANDRYLVVENLAAGSEPTSRRAQPRRSTRASSVR